MSVLTKKLTGLLLVLLLMFSSVLSFNIVRADEEDNDNADGQPLDWEVIDNDEDRLASKLNTVEDEPDDEGKKMGNVRVSIVLEGQSTLDNGFFTGDVSTNPGAIAYREALKTNQDSVANTISSKVLGGDKLDVVWNLTLAANIISANVPYDKIDEIRQVKGVKDVVIENQYFPQETVSTDDPNMTTATDMVASNYAWAQGYTGAGSLIAIVDTGLDIEHQSFDSRAFDMSISNLESETGKTFDLMDKKDVIRAWSMLNASQYSSLAQNAYVNSKVPYAFNYVDTDFDVTHVNDTEGEHGSHVASIAAGNKYIYHKDEDGTITLKSAFTSVKSQGNAPDAQLLVMKVFGKGGGAYDSDYFAAIEDAIVLGADAVNLSLGSASAGFTYNTTYQDIIDGLTGVDIVWTNSAGNNGTWADQTPLGYLYSEDKNLSSGGSPGTYSNTMSVASVDNKGYTGYYLIYDEEPIFYTESDQYSNAPIRTIAGEHDYVYIDAYGTEEDFAKVADILPGKIAICSRGSTSFYQKAEAAVKYGAIATIIVNNQAGTINMDLTDYTHSQPCVSITLADGQAIRTTSDSAAAGGMTYWTGTITVGNVIGTNVSDDPFYTMSSFSSYGTPGDLSIKPEITAPGGNIYAVAGLYRTTTGAYSGGHDQYENMSGTSMAAPQMAGITGIMAQYVKENGLDETAEQLGLTRRGLIQSLLMSTAKPLINGDSGSYYSVMSQGSGLADVEAALNSNIVILMDSTAVNGENRKDISTYAADGKVKAELGDDPDRSGRYTVEFTINNISDKETYYSLSGDLFTQDIFYYGAAYLDTWTVDLFADLTWYVNGKVYDSKAVKYDFNDDGDGKYDSKDAKAILDYVVGNRAVIGDLDHADLDGDGMVTTHDAYLALELTNTADVVIPANAAVAVRVEIDVNDFIEYYDVNGAYVEGYLFIDEKESIDGAIGVTHSIPVLGYYGSWGEPKAVDVGSYVEYEYELEEREPYMSVSTALDDSVYSSKAQMFTGYHDALAATYVLGGNPLGSDFDGGVYYEERNAFNGANTLQGARYSLIRNVSAIKYELTDSKGDVVEEKEILGNAYASYYYSNQGTWQNTSTTSKFTYAPSGVSEGERLSLKLYGAPEYYLNNGSIDWEGIDPSMTFNFTIDNTAPVIDAVFSRRITSENEDGTENNTIIVTIVASDNEYIAGAFVYDEDGDNLFMQGARDTVKKTERDEQEYLVVVDGSDYSDHLVVELMDYAANMTTVKVNLNKDELEEPVEISFDEDYYRTVVGSSIKLDVNLTPWGIKDQQILWSSSDESIATVNDSGVVTGFDEGMVTITAVAHADQTKSAQCEVEFVYVDRELKAFIWDEEGTVNLSTFNTASLPDYTRLSEGLRLPLASTAYGTDGTLYAASFDSNEWTSVLYTIDEDTYEVTEVGPSSIAYMDLAPASALGDDILMAVYGPYVVLVDNTGGDYLGVFNYSNYSGGNYLVGITYEGTYYNSRYRQYVDYYLILDEAGGLYYGGFMPYGAGYANFQPQILASSIGYDTDIPYFQSLYYDGVDVYWSRFVDGDNRVDIIFIEDIWNVGMIYDLGSFDDGVWPVGGLYNDDAKDLLGIQSAQEKDDVIDGEAVLDTRIEKISAGNYAYKGTTDSIATGAVKAEEPSAVSGVQLLDAQGGVADTYDDLLSALNAAEAGYTLKLLSDVTENVTIPADKDVVLDLNGHTLTNETSAHTVSVLGKLTVKDSSASKAGKIVSSNNCGICVAGGELIVDSGAVVAQEMAVLAIDAGKLTINGGTFTAIDNAVLGTNGTRNRGNNTVTVNGGTFNGTIQTDGYVACGIYVANDDTVKVTGGTFNITNGAGIVARAGSVSVTGGTFNTTGSLIGRVGDSRVVVPCSAIVFDSEAGYPGLADDSKLQITGGTFVSEAAAVSTVGDGTYVDIDGGAFSDNSGNSVEVPEGKVMAKGPDGLYRLTDVNPDGTVMTTVVVKAEDALAKNGLYELTYDPAEMTFEKVETDLTCHAVNSLDAGKVAFAFADLDGVAADEVIAAFVFRKAADADEDTDIITVEENTYFDHNRNGVDDEEEMRTVTYTDGVVGAEIFEDKVFDRLMDGDATPAFGDDPLREGFIFTGWEPEVSQYVDGDQTYVAKWASTTWQLTLPYTEGTLTDDGASFEDFILNFTAADPAIGLMQDGYWVGFRFIAPEAVTAGNIANATYSDDGGQTWKSFSAAQNGTETDGRYHMNTWVPVTVASLEAGQTMKWTYKFAWNGDQSKAQTFVIEVDPSDVTLIKNGEIEIRTEDGKVVDRDMYFTVNFHADGGEPEPAQQVVRFNSVVMKPADPKKDQALFLGWYDGEELYDFSKPVLSDLELTAKWAVDTNNNGIPDDQEDFGEIWPEDRPKYMEDIPEGIWLSKLTDKTYTGKAITQDFRVYDHKKLLTQGKDYTVAYSNNRNVGTATVTVTGKGNYKDKISKTFAILKAELDDTNTVMILNRDTFVSSNNVQKPAVSSVEYNGVKLRNNTDYTVSYENPNSKSEGSYSVTITGKGNYAGTVTKLYTIGSNFKPVNTWSVTGVKNMPYAKGENVTLALTVKDGRTVLTENKDYVVEYHNNVNVGKAYVFITGMGDYAGSITKSFSITPLALKASDVTVDGLPDTIRYAGEYKPDTRLYLGNIPLKENEDYTVTFRNYNKAGTATVVFKGINNYSGSFSKTYKITAVGLNDITIRDIPAQPYVKGGNRPDVEAYDTYNDVALVLNKDYTLTYANNTKPGTATVTFKGKGSYSGTVKMDFVITTSDLGALSAAAPDKVFANRNNAFKSTLTITDTNGKKLAAGTDYDRNVVYTYVNDTELVSPANEIRLAGSEVQPSDIVPAGTEIRVTATAKGNNYTGTASAVYRIVAADIASARVTIPGQIYTGNPIQLDKSDITVKLNGTTLNPEDFEIVSYTNNTNKGTAKVTIRGLGNYGGTKTVNFSIVQKSFINALWLLFS